MKFRIIPENIDEEPKYKVETKFIWVFIKPL